MSGRAAANPLYRHLLAELPLEVRETFTPSQLAALARASQAQGSRHAVDYRVSLPFLFGRSYYLTVLAGRERRSHARLQVEGQHQVSRIAIFYGAATTMAAGSILVGLLCAIYLLESMSGINIFDGESPLHPLYILLLGR